MSFSGASFSPASYLSCYRERKVLSFTFVYLPVTAKSFGQTSSLNRKNKHHEWQMYSLREKSFLGQNTTRLVCFWLRDI